MTLAHGPRSMWTEEKRVYERVERPSVYPIDWQHFALPFIDSYRVNLETSNLGVVRVT